MKSGKNANSFFRFLQLPHDRMGRVNKINKISMASCIILLIMLP